MITINQTFDSGNIEVIDSTNPDDIQLNIRRDNQSDFFQWFHFRVSGAVQTPLKMRITNAHEAAFEGGWEGYNAVASYDQAYWFRVPARYDNGELVIEHTPDSDIVSYAYFAPYTLNRHEQLLSYALQDERCTHEALGQTLQGRNIDCLRISNLSNDQQDSQRKVWMTARQHPGESMAEWFAEGFLQELLDTDSALAETLLENTTFYVVPNMNPDGSYLGHLRTNAIGVNLNREWKEPSMERSPEVYVVREKLMQTGCDLFLDIHGDEALPWNFIAGQEGTDASTEILAQEANFERWFQQVNPDFQTEHGYPPNKYGPETLTLGSKWAGHHFGIPSLTLEMPFKDNAARPDPEQGWSPERSMRLGASILFPIARLFST